MIDKERALREHALLAGLGRRRLQRRRRQRLPRLHRPRHARRSRRSPSPPTAPAIPSRHRQMAVAHRRPLRPPPRDHPHRRARAARVPRQPGQPLLLLQARALHAPDADRRATAARSSSTATTPTIAATTGRAVRRRASSACAARSTRSISARTRSASCRARAGLPTWDEPASACLSSRIPYHPRSDRREAADDRARRAGAARARLPRLPRPAPRRPRPHRARPRRAGARARARDGGGDRRELKAVGYRYVTIDLQGYRTGSLNEGLLLRPRDAATAADRVGASRARGGAVPRAHLPFLPPLARRSRLDQLRARRPRLRRRRASAASARLSAVHRSPRRCVHAVGAVRSRTRSACSAIVPGALWRSCWWRCSARSAKPIDGDLDGSPYTPDRGCRAAAALTLRRSSGSRRRGR